MYPPKKKSVVTGFYYITQMKVMGNEFMASVDFIYLKHIQHILQENVCCAPPTMWLHSTALHFIQIVPGTHHVAA